MTRKRILLVEDNADDELLILDALRKGGVRSEVQIARDGAEALEFLLGDDVKPRDLVLLDLKLPKISGFDVLRRIRANKGTKYLPVVILTSSSEAEDIIRSYRTGANSYVRKPVEAEQFNEAVRTLGLYWLRINEPAPAE